MKKIIITEAQFKKLLEGESTIPAFDGGDLTEYPGSEISTTANVTDNDGDLEYGDPTNTDEIQRQLSIQSYWGNLNGGGRLRR